MILVSIIPRYPKTHLRLISSTTGLLMPKGIRMLPHLPAMRHRPDEGRRGRGCHALCPGLDFAMCDEGWELVTWGATPSYSWDWVGFHGRFHGRFHGVSVWDIWMAYFYWDFSSSPNFCTPSQQLGGCVFLGISELSRLCQSIDSIGD